MSVPIETNRICTTFSNLAPAVIENSVTFYLFSLSQKPPAQVQRKGTQSPLINIGMSRNVQTYF